MSYECFLHGEPSLRSISCCDDVAPIMESVKELVRGGRSHGLFARSFATVEYDPCCNLPSSWLVQQPSESPFETR